MNDMAMGVQIQSAVQDARLETRDFREDEDEDEDIDADTESARFALALARPRF